MAHWMTIPEWANVKQIDVRRREQCPECLPDAGTPEDLHILIRGRLLLPQGLCTLRVSADDYAHIWLDGSFLGCGPAAGWPEAYHFCEYTVDGGKWVSVALHLYYHGRISRAYSSGDGRMAFYVSVHQNGAEIKYPVDTWRYRICNAWTGPSIGYDTQFLEHFDSRQYPHGWEQPDHDDSAWNRTVPAAWADYQFQQQPDVPLQWSILRPVSVTEKDDGVLLDFGKIVTGTLQCTATGTDGDRINISCWEGRDRSGFTYDETWTLGDGINHLHWFDYKTFRFIHLSRMAEDISVLVRHYPMDDGLCTLDCPTDQLSQIFEICKNAVRCCTQEAYLDCPSREKGQYLGDAILTARSHLWLTGDNRLLRKCIRDFIQSSAIAPSLMAVAPGSWMQEIADFSLLFPELVLLEYEFSGDLQFLRECYPAVAALTDAFDAYMGENGLLWDVDAQWNLVDWPESCRDHYDFPLTRPVVEHGCHNVINALWFGAWKMREQMEQLLDISSQGRSAAIAKSLREAFWRPEQGLFADAVGSDHCSLHANIYAAYFGIHPDPDRFEELMLQPNRHCGVFPMYFALRALCRMGKQDTMYRLLTRQDAFGWRNMLRQGATAAFEVWGMEQKWNTSLCHGWASYPISLIIEDLAGLHPNGENLAFSPHLPEHITHFSLRVPYRNKIYRTDGKELSYVITPDE